MKSRHWMILAVCLVLGSWLPAQGFEHYRQTFWQQLSETCRPGLRWEKSVTKVEEDGSESKETKVFEVDCIRGTVRSGESTMTLQPAEFGHLFEFAYDNPYHSPHLDITEGKSGVVAKLKTDAADKSKLRLQRFEMNEQSGKLKLAEAWILKNTALYDLEVHIWVWFDDAGQYLRHEIETKTEVLLGGTLQTRIQARLVP